MIKLIRSDLDFILDQIIIAEQLTAGVPVAQLIPHHSLPYGLREVDGGNNNLLPGQENFGAADQLFPRIVPASYLNDPDGDVMVLPGPDVTNNNYGVAGDVADADPRIISNLLVDQTLTNKVAVIRALELAGSLNPEADYAVIEAARQATLVPGNAATAAQKTEAAYEKALLKADDVAFHTAAAFTALTNLNTGLGATYTAGDVADAAAAKFAVDAAVAAQALVVSALTAGPATAADLLAATTLMTNLNSLDAAVELIVPFVVDGNTVNVGVEDVAIADAINNATHGADVLDGVAATNQTALVASEGLAQIDSVAADGVLAGTITTLRGTVAGFGVTMGQDFTLTIVNVATDEGLSAPFNSWFTLFGQFFDHGLDLVTKGGNGTVYIPLQPDDPLITHGPDGIAGSGDEITDPALQFMALKRATPTAGQHENTTTSWVDQNQTYTSHASHQVFLREYALDVNFKPVATGKLLDDPVSGGLANWAQVKQQAKDMLGITLSDYDVVNVPLLRTDEYGKFIPDPLTGFAQVIVSAGTDTFLNTSDDVVVSGTPTNPINLFNVFNTVLPTLPVQAQRTGHAFLDDIAHAAAPFHAQTGAALLADEDNPVEMDGGIGIDLIANPHFSAVHAGPTTFLLETTQMVVNNPLYTGSSPSSTNPEFLRASRVYDNETLDIHKVTGDGRGNENIGLLSVHHVFHSEHNHVVDQIKATLSLPENADIKVLWELSPGVWNGERLFQAAKFATEMQYQHLVFEEFARKVQPLTNIFTGYHGDIDPSILAEFAHVVYRFGHSMLNEDVARMNPDGTTADVGLIEAFLNPGLFDASGTADAAAGEVVRGMTRQTGNAIDEFVTGALRNNLLGIPLDLPVLNIARARDTGSPSLNDARAMFHTISGNDPALAPYPSWAEFELALKHPLSIVNFIAAYGKHGAITSATTLEAKREAAMLLRFGDGNDADGVTIGANTYIDRQDFLNGFGPTWNAETSGLNDVDFWIGGLAEATNPFGGMLGSSFNFVFETQLEKLQDADRFYYLGRLAGTNLLSELEGNSFAKIIMNNTDILGDGMHLPADIFSVPAWILEVDQSKQVTGITDTNLLDPVLRGDPANVVRDNPQTPGLDTNYLRYTGGDHVVLGGTNANDTLHAGIGDDTVWGDDGDDRIEGNRGVDQLIGGAGDDIITDLNGDDNIKGEGGNDVVNSGDGFDLILLGDGSDFSIGGANANETFGGEGNDFIFDGDDFGTVFGGGGDDWIEGGNGADLLQGDFGNPFQDSKHAGNDVIRGGGGNDDYDSESGDDIMLADDGIERNEGMLGFDWVSYKYDAQPANADMLITGLLPPDQDALRDRFDLVEGLSGWNNNDTLRGNNTTSVELLAIDPDAGFNHAINNAAQMSLINGLSSLLGGATTFSAGNIILGGGGSDLIEGRGGNDFIDGDAKLNVRISIRENADGTGAEIGTADGMLMLITSSNPLLSGKVLSNLMFDRTLNPGQLQIVREITTAGSLTPAQGQFDYALYSGPEADYTWTRANGITTITDNVVDAIPFNGIGNAPTANDGTDTLRRVEYLRFTNRDANGVFLSYTDVYIGPSPATGQPVILDANGGTPTETQVLTADTSGIADLDGLGAFSYQWQRAAVGTSAALPANDAAWTDIPGANSDTFTPDQSEVNQILRLVITFTDEQGTGETVISAATAGVGDAYNGGGGNDNPAFSAVAGSNGPTAFDDILNGNGGDDTLNGAAGNDTIRGGLNADSIDGGAGNDLILYTMGDGADTMIDGGADADTLAVTGTVNNDTLNLIVSGGVLTRFANASANNIQNIETITVDLGANAAGGDFITYNGTTENVTVDLGAGIAPGLTSFAGIENVQGGAGNDTLTGDTGANILGGNNGDDTLIATVDDVRDILGGNGHGTGGDTADYSAYGATVNLTANLQAGGVVVNSGSTAASSDTISGIENFIGGAGNDSISGSTAANILVGGLGNDTINGSTGADSLVGGDGDDDLAGGSGIFNDTLSGGAGNDTFRYTVVGTSGDGIDTIDGGADADTLIITGQGSTNEELDVMFDGTSLTLVELGVVTGVEAVTANLLGGSDRLSYNGSTAAVNVDLTAGTASGFTSITSIENVTGGSGGDTLRANGSVNVLAGNGGDDTIIATVDNLQDTFGGNGGVNTADYSAYTTALTVTLLAAGNATVVGSGTTAGTSDLIGQMANFIGGSAGDTITGTTAVNDLRGGGGVDIITGANGSDLLYGGAGNDVFNYDGLGESSIVNAGTEDNIMDFEAGDIIDLLSIDANGAVAGDQAFVFTAGDGAGAFTAAGQLRFFQVDTDANLVPDSTRVQGNVGGANGLGSDLDILLKGYTGTLTSANFLF